MVMEPRHTNSAGVTAADVPHHDDDMPLALFGMGGSTIVGWAWLDPEDWKVLRRFRWWMTDGYAWRSTYDEQGRKSTIPMHREIMGLENGHPMEVDHIDRCRTHNCRRNLRIVDRWTNETNKPRWEGASSKYTGVSMDHRTGRWKAQAHWEGEYIYLGTFDTEEAAAAARWHWEDMVGRQRWDERARAGGDLSEIIDPLR